MGAARTCLHDHDHIQPATTTTIDLLPCAQENKGSISVAELRHVLSNIGEKLSPDELEELTKEADPEKKGRIEYDAFIKVRGLSGRTTQHVRR